MNALQQFHIKNRYYVQVKHLPKTPGCFVKFPNNLFINQKKIEKTYILDKDSCIIEMFTLVDGEKIVSKEITATKSNIRLLVLEDIALYTLSLGLSKNLIVTEGDKTLFDMLTVNRSRKDAENELKLCYQFRNLLLGIPNHNITDVEGYSQIVKCFENGGLDNA